MKLGIVGGALVVILIVAAILGYSSMFTVYETQQALVVRLGQPVRGITQPGLNFKVPLIDSVIMIDKRILDLENPAQEVIASDQKRLVVDAFARYRIEDPLQFYQTLGSIAGANSQLSILLNSALRRVLGEKTMTDVVRDERQQLMTRVRELLDKEVAGLRHQRDRCSNPPRRPAGAEQPGGLSAHADRTSARGGGIPRARLAARRRKSAPGPIATSPCCSPMRRRSPSRSAARATANATASSPMPSARTRTSSRSTARCRPTRQACAAATPAWCCGRIRSSSGTSSDFGRQADAGTARRAAAAPAQRRPPQSEVIGGRRGVAPATITVAADVRFPRGAGSRCSPSRGCCSRRFPGSTKRAMTPCAWRRRTACCGWSGIVSAVDRHSVDLVGSRLTEPIGRHAGLLSAPIHR